MRRWYLLLPTLRAKEAMVLQEESSGLLLVVLAAVHLPRVARTPPLSKRPFAALCRYYSFGFGCLLVGLEYTELSNQLELPVCFAVQLGL